MGRGRRGLAGGLPGRLRGGGRLGDRVRGAGHAVPDAAGARRQNDLSAGLESAAAPRRRDALQGGPMQFSIILEAQTADASPAKEAQVLQECAEQAVLAEQQGFDRVWAVEHHCLKWYAHMSAPETFLAYIAGATSRIRVGHGVVCLPFKMNHPIK